jgi:hypothetical protein
MLPALKFVVGVIDERERDEVQVSGECEVGLKCFLV